MTMKTIVKLIGVGVLLTATTAAFANFNHQGAYIGGNLGWGKVNETVSGAPKQNNTGFAFSADAGYMFNQYIGAELGYNQYPDETFGAGIRGNSNYSFDIAAKGVVPINNSFNLFGKLGLASVHHNLSGPVVNARSTTKPAVYLAGGVGYDFTDNFGVNAQVAATTKNGNVPSMYGVTGGLQFNFG